MPGDQKHKLRIGGNKHKITPLVYDYTCSRGEHVKKTTMRKKKLDKPI